MNKKKFIINNKHRLNKDHQLYLYELIKYNEHSNNNNGFFFKMTEMDEETIDVMYQFIDKIITAKDTNDIERMELRDDLIKGLKKEETVECIISKEMVHIDPISVVISERRVYNMDDIERNMKEYYKTKKYKTDSIFFKLDKQMKAAKKSVDAVKSKTICVKNEVNEVNELNEVNEVNEVNETDEIEGDEEGEVVQEEDEDEDEDIDEYYDEVEIEEIEEIEEEVEEEIEEIEEVEELDENKFRLLLLSKGYSVTDNSQLKEEPYLIKY
jgi:hypothetical protein